MKFEKRKLADLKAAEYNPRVALEPGDPEFEKIARSIETFGYVDPIIINKDGTIIGGHQRCRVMKYMGITEADVVVVDMSKEKEKALNIALNKITGRWDDGKLKDLLIDLDGLSIDLSVTGFDSEELKNIIGPVNMESLKEDAEKEYDGGGEVDLDDFDEENFEHQCPRCGFKFN